MIQRSRVSSVDCWDLTLLFKTMEDWEMACSQLEVGVNDLDSYQGKLGSSEQNLFEYFQKKFLLLERLESVSYYAYLKRAEDLGNSVYQGLHAKAMHLQTLFAVKCSFENPELLKLSAGIAEK